MPRTHTVDEGEDIVSIAQKYRTYADAIWKFPGNAKLREQRQNPFVLNPGDVLQIPGDDPKKVAVATDKKHTFRRKNVKETLIIFLERNGKPRAGLPYVLTVEDRRFKGSTGSDGKLEQAVLPTDRKGKLIVKTPDGDEEYPLELGFLDPVTEDSGLRARLYNLGYLLDEGADERGLEAAIERFQYKHQLKVTGQADNRTRLKLVEMHRS